MALVSLFMIFDCVGTLFYMPMSELVRNDTYDCFGSSSMTTSSASFSSTRTWHSTQLTKALLCLF